MAKAKSPPPAAPPEDRPSYVEAPPPQYAAPPAELIDTDHAFDALRETCRNASYNLLDKRDGKWSLLTFGVGGGIALRTFNGFEEGLEFIRDANLPNVRCLALPGGMV